MQGLWKNNVSGWNKDSKRKRQTRKHFLKDKYNLIQKEIWSSEYKHVTKEEYIIELKNKKVKYSESKCCDILFKGSIIEAWTDNSSWYTYCDILEEWNILSYDNFYYEDGYKKEIKILRVKEFYNKEYEQSLEVKNISFDKDKFYYKGELLKKYKYCFNKYHYYGSYKELLIINRCRTKSQLKNWEKYENELSLSKNKYIWLWG